MADKVFLTELYPKVEKAFTNKQNVANFSKMVSQFIDRNAEKLSAIGPTKNILFFDRDREPLFSMVGVSMGNIRDMRKKSKDLSAYRTNLPDNPALILLANMARFFSLKNDEKMVDETLTYMIFSLYFIYYHKYFQYDPNENIMAYTVNNLSEKYTLKKEGNLYKALLVTTKGAYQLKVNDLKNGNDVDFADFIISIKTRLNSFVKNIRNEFDKNYKNKKYLNTEIEDMGDGSMREADASIYSVNKIASKVTMNLITNGPNSKLVRIAANNNHVSVNEMRNYTNSLINKNNADDIRIMTESILQLYLVDDKNKVEEINSDKFLFYCLDIYKKSRSIDENIVNVKRILDKWIEQAELYKKTQRIATINDFKRAIYTFMILSIQYINR